jgi:hypothetical protein
MLSQLVKKEFLNFRILKSRWFTNVQSTDKQNAGQYQFFFDVTKNTFAATNSMVLQILWIGTVGASDSTIELISALEQLPGFSANWTSNLSSVIIQ